MPIQAGQASSASRVATSATAIVTPRPQRITITPDPDATPGDEAAKSGVVVPVVASYVTVPGLISGIYE